MKTNSPYSHALNKERFRERKRRMSKQGVFEAGFLHLDLELEESKEYDKIKSWLSDDGAAVERMIDEIDLGPDGYLSEYNRKLHTAANRLRRHMPEAVRVFLLICKNGNNREESIRCLAAAMAKAGKPKSRSRKANISHS